MCSGQWQPIRMPEPATPKRANDGGASASEPAKRLRIIKTEEDGD